MCVVIGMTGFRFEHMSATSLFRLLSLLVVQQLVSEDASICLVCHCVCALFTADVRDISGQSPLDCSLEHGYSDKALENRDKIEGCVDIALYLMNHGCDGNQEKGDVLFGACYWGRLDMVKELVEQHKVDPSECLD